MDAFGKLSIRSKITAIIVLTTALALGAGFLFMLITGTTIAKRDLVENHTAVARITGAQCVTDLAFGDREEATATLSKLGSIPDVQAAFLFDESGELFSTYQREESNPKAHPHGLLHEARFEDGLLFVEEPIIYQDQSYGSIHLVISTERLRDKLRDSFLTIVPLLLVLIAGAALLAWRLEAIVSKPILELVDAAHDISERHDYSVRVEKRADDEIGTLSDGFNDMLEQIERRQGERDEADQRTREKSQFLANMSHELRTPLNSIIGFSEILKTRLAESLSLREQKFIDNINSSGQHLLGIVNDILDLSKIEAGRMEVHQELFPIDVAVDGVCNLMRGVSGRSGITFDIRIEQPVPRIRADIVKVKQVLYNLLSNAVKFSHEGSNVIIDARTLAAHASPLDQESVRIDVTDHGIGIDPANHDSIFREFQQVDGTISRRFEGTGLGLALVKKFVEMHHGQIEIESALGEGSTFSIILPVDADTSDSDGASLIEPGAGDFIALVIEDERPAWEALRAALDSSEFTPVHADTGEKGLELAAAVRPAVILLDIVLPGMGGFDVLRALKSDPALRDIPVVVVSIMDDNRELGFALGVDDYLTKPIDPSRLLASLRRLLETSAKLEMPLVLVIDDDPLFHEIVEAQLADERLRFAHATDGHNGLRIAREESPALIVLDLLMEDMDGFEVAVRLRENQPTASIPILVATAHDLGSEERSRLRGKINALIEKQDLSRSKILSLVRQLVPRITHTPDKPA